MTFKAEPSAAFTTFFGRGLLIQKVTGYTVLNERHIHLSVSRPAKATKNLLAPQKNQS